MRRPFRRHADPERLAATRRRAHDAAAAVVEVDGGQHALALATVDDALRQNEVVLRDERVLRVPVIGLRLEEQRFMAQVAQAHRRWSRRSA